MYGKRYIRIRSPLKNKKKIKNNWKGVWSLSSIIPSLKAWNLIPIDYSLFLMSRSSYDGKVNAYN